MNTKEMYDEIAALLGAVAKAFDLADAEAARAVEDGRITLEMGQDDAGQRFVRAGHGGRFVRIYDGRIQYEDEPEGGCGCGH